MEQSWRILMVTSTQIRIQRGIDLKIVMLPGLDGTGELFERFAACLPSTLRQRICRYPLDASLGYDELQQFVEKQLPVDEPYVILGESFSGPIAIRIASHGPELLKGLVLVNTFIACPRPKLGRLLSVTPDYVLSNPPKIVMKYLLRGSEVDSLAVVKVSSVINSLNASIIRRRLEEIRVIDVTREASEVKIPVCVVQSHGDTFIPLATTQQLKSTFESCQEITMKGDHFLLQTHPNLSAMRIAEFCHDMIDAPKDKA